jgi:hypothetical protein
MMIRQRILTGCGWLMLTGLLLTGISLAQDAALPVPAAIDVEESGHATSSGTINRIGDNEIVVDDSLYPLSSVLELYSANGRSISFRDIQEGIQIGFQLNQEGEMVALWKIKL